MLLERALLFTLIMHGLAMISMVLFLLPGLPGGSNADDAQRIAYIAHQPWCWRLGWLPWQVTALSNLWLCYALARTAWISRPLAYSSLLLSLVAVYFEQPGEFWWITKGVELAQAAVSTSN